MKVILTGGTGFIGEALTAALVRQGHHVVLLTRHPASVKPAAGVGVLAWDGENVGPWAESLDGADAVINLAGEPIAARRWTPAQKKKIEDSRVHGAACLVSAIKKAGRRPGVLINASAVGYYGNVEKGDVRENHPRGNGFLADVCARWEEAAFQADPLGVRVVCVRIGIVLEKGGGALEKMIPPFRFYIGGPLGTGKQGFPWIHRDDVIGIMLYALEHKEIAGPVNAVAPQAADMKDFCRALGRAMNRPSWAPVPGFVLKTLLGEMSEMLLEGQKAVPEKMMHAGYAFQYPMLDPALSTILRKGRRGL
ncbi:MAG TPA: TIGR01777 family oxidoreductase [Verrucomicrobiae bacterium]|nr:TIGR01777 family oxidoreductase [Verrucomicrobiae bacterium]